MHANFFSSICTRRHIKYIEQVAGGQYNNVLRHKGRNERQTTIDTHAQQEDLAFAKQESQGHIPINVDHLRRRSTSSGRLEESTSEWKDQSGPDKGSTLEAPMMACIATQRLMR